MEGKSDKVRNAKKSLSAALIISVAIIVILATASLTQDVFGGGGGGRRSGITQECNEKSCEVRMTGAMFMTETLKVRPGATVAWSTTDKMPHTITSRDSNADASPLFNSDIISPTPEGKQWEMKFENKGAFDYFCQIHPGMAGQVVVAGEPIEDFSRLAFMMLMAAGVFGTFGAVAIIRLKQK